LRTDVRSGSYSYENREAAVLSAVAEKQFRFHPKAWKFFQSQPPGYRKTAIWWVIGAKRDVTRQRRLEILITDSEASLRIGAVLLKRDIAKI